MPDYMTVDDVAKALEVHPNTVLNMCRDGRLKARRFDVKETSPWMIDPASFRAYQKRKADILKHPKEKRAQTSV